MHVNLTLFFEELDLQHHSSFQMTTLQRLSPSTGRILSRTSRTGGLSRFSYSLRSYSKKVVKGNSILLFSIC